MKLFEYVIFKNEKKNKDGKIEEAAQILIDRTMVLVKDEAQAQIMAARAIPVDHMEDLDRVVIALRPF